LFFQPDSCIVYLKTWALKDCCNQYREWGYYEEASRSLRRFGSLVGNVKDASDAVIGGVTVTLTNKETTQACETTTGDAGSFDFPTVPAGVYELKVVKEGFGPQVNDNILVAANDTVRANITLRPGAVTETVIVRDGSVKNLAGYTQITSKQNLGRDFDERHLQFDLRISF
jgi:hypothetical protein